VWILNCRQSDSGGGLRTEVQSTGNRPRSGELAIIFVHGFNKHADEARDQAATLHTLLVKEWDWGKTRTCFGAFIWPATPWRMISAITYPQVLPAAEKAGRALGNFLLKTPTQEVVLIGHSLGALVVLQAALRVKTDGSGLLRGLLLTGAAVESEELKKPLGEFGTDLASREGVLYCRFDLTLQSLFRVGQRSARPFNSVSSAVGINGEPLDRPWGLSERTQVYDHRYWRQPVTAHAISRLVTGVSSNSTKRQVSSRPRLNRS
jgi:pimeloyl-ACP methyl ester carboxylesterase